MVRHWENEYNERAKMKRRRAHRDPDREVMKHAISQDFIKGKDILHELIHGLPGSKENIPPLEVMDSQPQVMPIQLQDFDMDSLLEPIMLEDRDSLLEPITFDSLVADKDSLLEPILLQDFDMDSLVEPIDSLVEDRDSLLEDMDSLLASIVVDDKDSLLEPTAFNCLSDVKADEFNDILCRLDSILEPVVVVERC